MYYKWFQLLTGGALICTRKSLLSSSTPHTFSFRCKGLQQKCPYQRLQASNFHTNQKLYYPTSPTLLVGSIICGYYLRKWWSKQDPKTQEMYIRWYRQRRSLIHGSLGFGSIVLIIYCLSCLQRDSVVRRLRFILHDEKQQMENAKFLFQLLVQTKENVVPLSDPMYSKVGHIIRKLGNCNREIFENTDWTVTIIYRIFDLAPIPNVLILPDKNIIVVYDIFNFMTSDDQLMFILAHEMSHQMLLHTLESLSWGVVSDAITVLSSFILWILFPGRMAAILCTSLYLLLAAIFSGYKRRTETEADEVGLTLAAKSCIDLREVLVFWEIMKTFEELTGQSKYEIPIFMGHPTLEERKRRTLQMMPKALELRKKAKCPPLPAADPQDLLPKYRKAIKKHLDKNQELRFRIFVT